VARTSIRRTSQLSMTSNALVSWFMRLGNHTEAEQAANFLGSHHKFVLSQFTATYGSNTTRTSSDSYSHGTSHSRGTSDTRSWPEDNFELERRRHHAEGLRVRRRTCRPAEPA
jgi:hypothetical protein